jgi:hypothetical protein
MNSQKFLSLQQSIFPAINDCTYLETCAPNTPRKLCQGSVVLSVWTVWIFSTTNASKSMPLSFASIFVLDLAVQPVESVLYDMH